MKKKLRIILQITCTILALIALGFAAWWAIEKLVTHIKADHFASFSHETFRTAFQRVGVTYPPKQLALLIFKDTKQLEIYARDDQQWKYIKTLPILAASGHAGPKLREGDLQVPEGIYNITALNPFSHFTLSMKINYPNHFDKIHAKEDHRFNLGGEIFIHGFNRSIGCLAMGDEGIEQLFPLVYQVGIYNTNVVIAPNDLRKEKPIIYPGLPVWTADLYQEIKTELNAFPMA